MAEEHARAKVYGDEESLAEQRILACKRGTKRTHALNTNTCAEESPPKKVNTIDDAMHKEMPAIATLAMSAEGGTPHAYQEELWSHLQESLANQDYFGPAAVKEEVGAAALKDELDTQLQPNITSNSTETSILSTMTAPVARFISGHILETDLSPDATVPDGMPIPVVEARQRIARSCGVADQ